MKYTIDIDTGGSFTDGFITAGDRIELVKVDTTPHDLTVCLLNCIELGASRFGISVEELLSRTVVLRHATTIGTNCWLQKSGPKLGLIVTDGFADTLYAPNNDRETTEAAATLARVIPSNMRIEVREGIDDTGSIVQPLDAEAMSGAVEDLLDSGARSMVVSLRNSAFNTIHEELAKRIIDGEYPRHYLGSVPVLTASAITAHPVDHIRASTAILNAYIHRDMVRYLYRAEEQLRRRGYRKPMLVAHSSGGTARVAKTTALNTYNSGPVAGLIGCSRIAGKLYGIRDFVSVDVGGTSVDIGVGTAGKVAVEREPFVDGLRIGLPMVTLGTAAGGGGSIATVDTDSNAIKVGPESAGAMPGPVAYDLGGIEPTIADADLVLGYLDPDYFLGGTKKLKKDKATVAITNLISAPLGRSVAEASWEIVQTSESNVVRQVRQEIERKGLSPESLTLFAFGGGGGLRCCGYASRLGISRVIVFSFNAVASAFGASTTDVLHTYERPTDISLNFPSEWTSFNQSVADMVAGAERDMKGEGFAPEDLSLTLELALSGSGGLHWVESPLTRFEEASQATELSEKYALLSGINPAELKMERILLRAECPTPHYELPQYDEEGPDPRKAKKGSREIYCSGRYMNAHIYERDLLECGNRIDGPAIVEATDTTYLVPPGWRFTTDKYLNGIIEAV
jgi:N-methylhydantoinase A/acetophenone carboxylase